jgi:ferredoxin
MTKKNNDEDKDDEKTLITNRSNDHLYYAMIPRLVQAVSRNPYDFTLWCIYKDIAGEKNKCTLGTPQLAALSMMSEGQVADSRKYLLEQGLLEGEKINGTNSLQLWHIWIPDIWRWNLNWSETHKSIKSRIQWKADQKEEKNKIEKICRRCHQPYETAGRRSKRCQTCQEKVNAEKESIYTQLKQPQKKFLEKINANDRFCIFCEGTDDLELHLDSNLLKLTVVCEDCHDIYHNQIDRIHAMNPVGDTLKDSPHESDVSSHESLVPPHESSTTPHESKKNVLEESLNNNKKRDSYIIWKQVWKRTKDMFGVVADLWDGNPYIAVWEGDTLVVVVPNKDWHNWMVERQGLITKFIKEVDPRSEISFKLMS